MRICGSAETVTMSLLRDLRHDAGAPRPPPLPDREPQLLLHRDRHDQLDRHRHVVPRHHHLHARRQRAHARHVRRPKVELRPVPVEKRRVPPPLLLRQHVDLRLELPVRLDRPRLGEHLPPPYLLLFDPPPPKPPPFPPPSPPPRSPPPVTTAPRPVIEKMSSIGIRNGLSTGRGGVGM